MSEEPLRITRADGTQVMIYPPEEFCFELALPHGASLGKDKTVQAWLTLDEAAQLSESLLGQVARFRERIAKT